MKHNSHDFTTSEQRMLCLHCTSWSHETTRVLYYNTFIRKSFTNFDGIEKFSRSKKVLVWGGRAGAKCIRRSNASKSQLVFYFCSQLMYAKEIFGYRFNTYTTIYKIFILSQKRM